MTYSIILPVLNGGEYVKQCVKSILTQELSDFELIILDNCSDDGSIEWLRQQNESRIQIQEADRRLTIDESWARIRRIPKSELMTIIGHDDVLDKNYLAVMNELIKSNPEASLYQSHFRYIDKDGKLIRKCRPMQAIQQPADVIHNFLCGEMDIMGTGFMMRSADYDDVGGIPAYPSLLFC